MKHQREDQQDYINNPVVEKTFGENKKNIIGQANGVRTLKSLLFKSILTQEQGEFENLHPQGTIWSGNR